MDNGCLRMLLEVVKFTDEGIRMVLEGTYHMGCLGENKMLDSKLSVSLYVGCKLYTWESYTATRI